MEKILACMHQPVGKRMLTGIVVQTKSAKPPLEMETEESHAEKHNDSNYTMKMAKYSFSDPQERQSIVMPD